MSSAEKPKKRNRSKSNSRTHRSNSIPSTNSVSNTIITAKRVPSSKSINPNDRNRSSFLISKMCFLTVGTTNFDQLLMELDSNCIEFYEFLISNDFNEFIIQIGVGGKFQPNQLIQYFHQQKFSLTIFQLIPDISIYLSTASLIISHAGAGSILESLRYHRIIIVVVNELLMNNHQIELARALANGKYLYWTTPNLLLKRLKQADLREPVKSVLNNNKKMKNEENVNKENSIVSDSNDTAVELIPYRLRIYPNPKSELFTRLLDQETSELRKSNSSNQWNCTIQ